MTNSIKNSETTLQSKDIAKYAEYKCTFKISGIGLLLIILLLSSCKNKEKMNLPADKMPASNVVNALPQAIVYKTTADFSNLVPVIMNNERTKIISYPAPGDLYYNGKLSLPVALKNGYWLDNRGINENVVFLKYTYEEYKSLTIAPSIEEMMKNIAEKYPLTELYFCGPRNQLKNEITELNAMIDRGFENCRKADIVPMKVED